MPVRGCRADQGQVREGWGEVLWGEWQRWKVAEELERDRGGRGARRGSRRTKTSAGHMQRRLGEKGGGSLWPLAPAGRTPGVQNTWLGRKILGALQGEEGTCL